MAEADVENSCWLPTGFRRPVVSWADRAIIARPPELLLPLLGTGRDPAPR